MTRRLLGSVVLAAALLGSTAASNVAAADASAVGTAGTAHTFGENNLGQQGGDQLAHVVAIAAGRDHALALTTAGTVWAWGDNSKGAVGDGSTVAVRPTPVPVLGLTGVTAIATGHYHSLALLADGTARTWGFGTSGQLGNGARVNQRTPVAVTVSGSTKLDRISKLAAGRAHSLALRDGKLYAWGDNTYGQIGDGTETSRSRPVPVPLPVDVVDVAGGRDHTLAVGADGSLWAWGRNDYGQLGTGNKTRQLRPVRILTSGAVDVEAGAFFSLVRTATGSVLSWGRNNFGQLGLGSTVTRNVPTAIPGLNGIRAIGCGRDHAAAVRADGTVVDWGLNDAGQLGDGTRTNRLSPIPLVAINGAEAVGGGRGYTAVLTSD